jgi:ribosomal protein S28E/S33
MFTKFHVGSRHTVLLIYFVVFSRRVDDVLILLESEREARRLR